ncbi:MAG: beta-galactosidase [bacterium]|jgi:hypothetical protein|nr:beta-galactosidase [Candidatus Cloacimonadota bacterium]MDD2485727.1 beta-galactosidase [bacterium]MDD3805009.1 beta-galactosidase [bacterium]MDD4557677.1 beta-galactosidase [bacterium]
MRFYLYAIVSIIVALCFGMEGSCENSSGGYGLVAEVNSDNGIPVLKLNKEKEIVIGYRDSHPVAHIVTARSFIQAGARIQFLSIHPGGRAYQGDKLYARLDSTARDMLKECPDIYFIILVATDINKTSEPKWFVNKEDQLAVWPPDMRKGDRASMASKAWREEVAADLRRLAAHVDNAPYADKVVGYFLCGGSGEWNDYWDYSQPAQQGFAEWLSDKYGNNIQLLKEKWKSKDITFETIRLPSWNELCVADDGIFYTPERSRRIIDFMYYHHQVAADTVIDFAKAIKEETGNRKLVGLWNGYIFLPGWWNGSAPYNIMANWRTKMFSKVLESPYIDFIAAPYSYQERHSGGFFVPQIPMDSIIFHGKMGIIEEDTRTHLTTSYKNRRNFEKHGDIFGKASDANETMAILKRNFAGIFTKPGSGLYYFGLTDEGNKWFDNAAILDAVKEFKEIAKAQSSKDKNISSIAVIVSNRSFLYQKINDLSRDFLLNQMYHNLTVVGAPFDVYLDTDLNDKRFPFDKYKIYIFLNNFYLPDGERALIKKKICTNNNTVVWIYASGYIDDENAQVRNISDLTGINISKYEGRLSRLKCVITNYMDKITEGMPTNIRFGSEQPLEPVFWVDDPTVKVLGELTSTTNEDGIYTFRKPGLAIKRFANWISIWSGAPNLPSSLLRNIAQSAGVHIYSDSDDQVFASQRIFSLHARYDGMRTIKFPQKTSLYDPFAKRYIARNIDVMKMFVKKGETLLWVLE